MAIFGYSERGIINSLLFSIGEDVTLMKEFINLIDIPELKKLGNPIDFVILLEQSFSEFGDADLVIKICYDNPDNNKVLFIEGKVKTSLANHWNIEKQFDKFKISGKTKEKYYGYSSNLFFQLHLKKLMIDNKNQIESSGMVKEPIMEDIRKIGKNEIVKKAFNLIKDSKAYFIGIVPSSQDDINMFTNINNGTGIHFLSWHKVKRFCKDYNLTKVSDNFEYNKGQIFNEK